MGPLVSHLLFLHGTFITHEVRSCAEGCWEILLKRSLFSLPAPFCCVPSEKLSNLGDFQGWDLGGDGRGTDEVALRGRTEASLFIYCLWKSQSVMKLPPKGRGGKDWLC